MNTDTRSNKSLEFSLSDLVDFPGDPHQTIKDGERWLDKIRNDLGDEKFTAMAAGQCLAIDVTTGRYVLGTDPASSSLKAVETFGKVPIFVSSRIKRPSQPIYTISR
jgi:hypothetical protein